MIRRALRLPPHPKTSFFLWGPRQTGKSTLLRALYPRARRIDLLTSREFMRDHSRVRKWVVVSLDERPRRTEDGIDFLPARVFAQRLWNGELIAARD